MKTPNEDIKRKVRQWVSYADEDLRLALAAMNFCSDEEPPYRLIAFHAQQCAEKYLKAFLQEHNVRFSHAHPLIDHLELCREVEAEFAVLDADLRELDGYAVRVRYPGVEVTLEMGREALAAAGRVRDFIRQRLSL